MERDQEQQTRSDSSPLCSVIIPHYNDAEGLASCLAALARQDFPREKYEVIVIDDCSAEDHTGFVHGNFPLVAFHRQPANRGPGAARNQGISLARGRYLVFTDSDACPGPEWLTTLVNGFAAGYDILCGPVWHGPGMLERLTALTAFGEYSDNTDGFRNHCPTVNFAVASAIMKNFLFDEEVKFAGEDMLLSTRLTAAGHKIRYLAGAWVMHKPKLSVASHAKRAFRYGIGFRDSRMRCSSLSGYWLHQYLRGFSGLPLFFIRAGIDLLRLGKLRKLLRVTILNLPFFLAGIAGTRLCYAAGVFWSYTGVDSSRYRKGKESTRAAGKTP